MSTRAATPKGIAKKQDEAAARRANTESRIQELLAQPGFRQDLEAVLREDEATLDAVHQDLIRRLREGEFAIEALVSIYGSEFVERLKTRLGE